MPWKVKLDVRDLGGILTSLGGPLSGGVREATHGVAAVGALLPGFQVKLGVIRGKYLPAGLHAVEASYVSSSSLSAFRAAIVQAVWSCKMPLAGTPAVLYLLDGLVGVDPAYHIVWARFRVMRRYLAYRPDVFLPRVLKSMVQCICRYPLLLRLCLLGMGSEQGWIRAASILRALPLRPGSSRIALRSIPGFERIFTTT